MKLESITEFGSDRSRTLPPHTFTYSGGSPPVSSTGVDHWGFYNQDLNSEPWPSYVLDGRSYSGANKTPSATGMMGGILTSITYPSGGSTDFEYEPHEAQYHTINKETIGGLRIKQIKHTDPISSNSFQKNYTYNQAVLVQPVAYSYFQQLRPVPGDNSTILYNCDFLVRTSGNLLYFNSSSPVIYTKVTEFNVSESTNGKTEYTYNYTPDLGDSEFPFTPPADNTWKSGQLLEKKVSSASGKLLYKEVNTYTESAENSNGLSYYGMTVAKYWDYPGGVRPGGGNYNVDYAGMFATKTFSILSRWLNLTKTEVYNYDQTDQNKYTKVTQEFFYDDPVHAQVTKQVTTDSKLVVNETAFKYPQDYKLNTPYDEMVNKFIINPVLEKQEKVNGNKTHYQKTEFEKINSLFLPKRIKSSFGNSTAFDELVFDSYDPRGNVTKFTDKAGIVTNLEWYQVPGKKDLVASRTLGFGTSVSQTTSYDYKPLVGITMEKDPADRSYFYNYDTFGRLSDIRENTAIGNLVKSFEYNYGRQGSTTGRRILIVGNSITKLIAQSGSDGWQSPALTAAGGWGRASSTQANDFVHILESRFKQLDANAQVLPLWEAPFERDYISSPAGWIIYDYTALQNRIANSFGSSSWKPDIVIIRLGENILDSEVELNNFKGAYNTLINKILEVSAPGAKVILTNSMWPDQPLANIKIQQVATERGLPFVDLSDMISNPAYLAGNDPASMGAFPNNTGDRHPGDAGMLEIADRIWSKVRNVDLPSNVGGNITKVRLYPRSETCCIGRITGSVIQGSNDISNVNGWTTLATITGTPIDGWNEYPIRTNTNWRYVRFLADSDCYGELKELEFYNGNVKLSGSKFGSSTAYNNDATNYGYDLVFDGLLTKFWNGTAAGPQNYVGLDLGASCTTLTASMVLPANNASVVGTAGTTAGRVIMPISVNTCVPSGSTITSVEIRAKTTSNQFDNRMGYAIADAIQPRVYKLSAQEGGGNGKWVTPAPLAPGTYRFYAVVTTATATYTTDYITVTLTASAPTGNITKVRLYPRSETCCIGRITGSVIQGSNDISNVNGWTTLATITGTPIDGWNEYPIQTNTTWRYVRFLADSDCYGDIKELEFYNGSVKLSGVSFGSSSAYTNDPAKWGYAVVFDGQVGQQANVWSGTAAGPQNYAGLDLGAGCSTLTARMVSPANNASVVGTASTTTAGRVMIPLSVATCAPTGSAVTSVEIRATTTSGQFDNRMGYAIADASQLGAYELSAHEGDGDGTWVTPAPLDPGTYRFYAVVKTATATYITDYITVTLTAPPATGNITKVRLHTRPETCCTGRITGSVIQGSNDISNANGWTTLTTITGTPAFGWNEYPISTTTTWRYVRFLADSDCYGDLQELEFYNGSVKLSGLRFGSSTAYTNDPAKWGYAVVFDGQVGQQANVWSGTAAGPQNYVGLDLGAGCFTLTASMRSPANNASVAGTASTTTTGRVTMPISVATCVPTGSAITSVEIRAKTTSNQFDNRMGYAIADASQPGVYKLSAQEGGGDGKWVTPAPLAPGTYRFYAVVTTSTATYTTDYFTITLTAP